MTPLLFAALTMPAPGFVLPILGIVALGAGAVVLFNYVQTKAVPAVASSQAAAAASTFTVPGGPVAGILSHLGQLLQAHTGGQANHRIASVAWSGLQKLLAYDAAQQHKEFDALLAHMGIKGVAAVPLANAGLDLLDKRLGISPETPPDLAIGLHQFAAAWWQNHQAKQQAAGKVA